MCVCVCMCEGGERDHAHCENLPQMLESMFGFYGRPFLHRYMRGGVWGGGGGSRCRIDDKKLVLLKKTVKIDVLTYESVQ